MPHNHDIQNDSFFCIPDASHRATKLAELPEVHILQAIIRQCALHILQWRQVEQTPACVDKKNLETDYQIVGHLPHNHLEHHLSAKMIRNKISHKHKYILYIHVQGRVKMQQNRINEK